MSKKGDFGVGFGGRVIQVGDEFSYNITIYDDDTGREFLKIESERSFSSEKEALTALRAALFYESQSISKLLEREGEAQPVKRVIRKDRNGGFKKYFGGKND